MLIVDDNMFRLAKMQETLLKVSEINRPENLKKYKEIVLQIDAKAFSDILEEIKHIDEHNHSLESESQFLDKIRSEYNQLLELQQWFKKVCSLYGENDLKVSELSQLNIEYIENRINAINGYLMNLKNIETNKNKLKDLSEQLADEEKKKMFLSRKLSELEDVLRENFLSAEGRILVDGKLEQTTVIAEYKKIDLDVEVLLEDTSRLDEELTRSEEENLELTDKLRTAEICYNSILTAESKQILEDIKTECLKSKYRLTMLKILKILFQNYNNYSEVKKKREDLLELIKYRMFCLENLGINVSIDPFGRTKVKEQLDIIISLSDNSANINKIMDDIGKLNSRTEEMIEQNDEYLRSLSDTKALFERKVGMNEIDITGIELSNDESKGKRIITDNQVIELKIIPSTLNMSIISQKTTTVIKRVNQMMNGKKDKQEKKQESFIPELVIISTPSVEIEKPTDVIAKEPMEFIIPETIPEETIVKDERLDEETVLGEITESSGVVFDIDDNLFESVTPFSEPTIFIDKTDEELPLETSDNAFPIYELEEEHNPTETESDIVEEMPAAFWVTQGEEEAELVEEKPLSFDDQIDILLSNEHNSKIRKKVA